MARRSWRARRQASGRRGCCSCGCGPLLLLLLLIVAVGAAFYFKLPQKYGLIKPAAERLLAAAPDRGCAAQILDTLSAGKNDTDGIELWVLPYKDKPGAIAYARLDGSEGFSFPAGSDDPIISFMTTLANNEAAVACGVQRVAIEYRMGEELSLMKLTASTKELQDYAWGRLSREQFMKAMEGSVNPAMLLAGGEQ